MTQRVCDECGQATSDWDHLYGMCGDCAWCYSLECHKDDGAWPLDCDGTITCREIAARRRAMTQRG